MKAFFCAQGMRLFACVIISAVIFYSANAEAADMALSELIDYSLRNNGSLKSFREEKGIREAFKIKAGLYPNPTMEFDGASGAPTGKSKDNSLSFGFSQEFLMAGKRGKRLKLAEQEMEMYLWQLADRERLLTEEVKTVFYDVVLTEQRILLADRLIMLNRQLLEIAKERLLAGDIPELEVNLVKVELARSENYKADVLRTLTQNRSRLWGLMGLPSDETTVVQTTFNDISALKSDLSELKRIARQNRPDVKALAAEKSRGDADINLARAERIPNVTTGILIKRDSATMDVGGIEGRDTAYTVGFKLSIPIPLFDRNQAGVKEASARRIIAETRFTALDRAIDREVETAFSGYEKARSILELFRTGIIPQLDENLKLTQEAYRLGELGILAVTQEQKKFFEVNDSYLSALYSRQIAMIKLESAVAANLTGGVK